MATVGDDCYFFCTSTCAKGAACPFRHVESAKTCKIICQHWQTNGCMRPMCKFRHSDFHIQINHGEIPCYWESQPVGCHKPNCMYKHSKPRPDPKPVATQGDPASSPKKESGSSSQESGKEAVDNFVMPIVKPVIIDPDSEASNSSPVKHSAAKAIIQEDQKNEVASSAAKLDKELKGEGESTDAAVQKKTTTAKKKKAVLKQKNGVKKAVVGKNNKVKKAVVSSPQKPPVKRKAEIQKAEKPAVSVKKVKDRLGVKPAVAPSEKKRASEEDESQDSDDSIENVKVLSMEEIFRQKALESMMKKRAAEGKPLLPTYHAPREETRPKPGRVRSATSIAVARKPLAKVVKKPPTPPPPPQSESEEEEEEEEEEVEEDSEENEEEGEQEASEEEEEEVVEEKKQDMGSSTSDSDSSSDSSSESEEETEVRRVVIGPEAEKAARDKAKASLLRKRQVNVPVSTASKIKKRKVINEKRSIKDRLGAQSKVVSAVEASTKRGDMRMVTSETGARSLSEPEDSASDDDGSAEDVKIKSLDDALFQKSKLQSVAGNSPVRERLGLPVNRLKQEEEEEREGRQILLTEGSSPKKSQKRPWSSGQAERKVQKEAADEDQRQVSTASSMAADTRKNIVLDEPESPFEALKRRILLQKTKQPPEDDVPEETKSDDESEEVVGKRKKHKHKHKHKKSKKVRQIYVPPGRKNSAMLQDTVELDRRKASPLKTQSLTPDTLDEDLPDFEEEALPQPKAPPQKPRHKVGAMWSAGLAVSSKGVGGGRPSLRLAASAEKADAEPQPPPVSIKSRLQTTSLSTISPSPQTVSAATGGAVPVVKTFSQIMAEKRQKRLQGQQDTLPTSSSSDSAGAPTRLSAPPRRKVSASSWSGKSRLSSKSEPAQTKAPITPIRFDTDGGKGDHPLRVKHTASSSIRNPSSKSSMSSQGSAISTSSSKPTEKLPSSPPKPQAPVSLASVRPSYLTARAKKLFKKPKESSSPVPPSDSSNHIASAESSSKLMSVGLPEKSVPSSGRLSPSWDNSKTTGMASSPTTISSSSSPVIKPQRRASTTPEGQVRKSVSVEDEFGFLDGGDMEDIGGFIGNDEMEPIDDLLQDIDDLLA